VAHAEGAGGGFADSRERFGQQIVQLLAGLVAFAQAVSFFTELGVREGLEGALQGIYGIGIVPQLPQGFFVTCAEKFFDK
jgi:hypothetical protein